MSFAQTRRGRYDGGMFTTTTGQTSAFSLALAILAAGGLAGMAFAGWIAHGSGMLVALAASGLAWCF
jgi:hypothetical protein